MADQIIDRLVRSLAAGLLGTDEFIDAVESQVGAIAPPVKELSGQMGHCSLRAVNTP